MVYSGWKLSSCAHILLIISSLLHTIEAGLYTSKDAVTILNSNNFQKIILETQNKRAWIVEFYNSWCGHCIRFAPTWKKLAADIKVWHRVVDIAVVDCSEEINTELCRHYQIDYYPQIKIFKPLSNEDNKGQLLEKTTNLTHAIIDVIEKITVKNERWPHLAPLKDLQHIWPLANKNTKHILVFYEEKDSYTGREVLLDLQPYKQILIRRMLKEDVKNMGITAFPSLFKVDQDGIFENLGKQLTREEFVDVATGLPGVTRDAEEESPIRSIQTSLPSKDKNITTKVERAVPAVYLQDLESAVVYSLRREVALQSTIEGSKLNALRSYITVLDKYFPSQPNMKSVLAKLHSWVLDKESSIKGEELVKYMALIQTSDTVLPQHPVWVGCRGSNPNFRGYPCSLWMLFHTLTVNSVIKYHHNKHFNPLEVLHAMSGYIQQFFGCKECAKHFGKMSATLDKEVQSPRDSILWLWRAHNKANARLHGDMTEDPHFPKMQFPSSQMCPKCYKFDKNGGLTKMFNEDNVLDFLINLYSAKHMIRHKQDLFRPGDTYKNNWWNKYDLTKIQKLRKLKLENIKNKMTKVAPTYDADKVEQWKQREQNSRFRYRNSSLRASYVMTSWGFNKIDMSLCVLLYIVGTGIIMLMYFHFTINRKRRLRFCLV